MKRKNKKFPRFVEEFIYNLQMANFKLDVEMCGEGAKVYANSKIIVGIFPESYPHTNYCGKILIDHVGLFDKWSSTFYMADYPTSLIELEALWEDIRYVNKHINRHVNRKWSKLRRTFL